MHAPYLIIIRHYISSDLPMKADGDRHAADVTRSPRSPQYRLSDEKRSVALLYARELNAYKVGQL